MQGLVNQLSQLLIVDRARLAGAYFVIESVDALIQKSETPFAHRGACELQALRDRAVGLAVSSRQHDARPRDQRSRNRARTRNRHQLCALVFAQHQFRLRSSHRHADVSRSVDVNMLRGYRSVNNGTGHQAVAGIHLPFDHTHDLDAGSQSSFVVT
ncbi:hypothetical protein WK66_00435 [Burkholderia ubonensis]|nr:hypothetical protein WK66_00435 [Burkholderia ubonensis]